MPKRESLKLQSLANITDIPSCQPKTTVQAPQSWSFEDLLVKLPPVGVCDHCNNGFIGGSSVAFGYSADGWFRITTSWEYAQIVNHYAGGPSPRTDAMFQYFFGLQSDISNYFSSNRKFYFEPGTYAYSFEFLVSDLSASQFCNLVNLFFMELYWDKIGFPANGFPFAPIMNILFALWPYRSNDSSGGVYKYGSAGSDGLGKSSYCIDSSCCLCVPGPADKIYLSPSASDPFLGAFCRAPTGPVGVWGIIMLDYEKMGAPSWDPSRPHGGMLVFFTTTGTIYNPWDDSYTYVDRIQDLCKLYGTNFTPNCWMSLMLSKIFLKMQFPYLNNDDIPFLTASYMDRPFIPDLVDDWLQTYNPQSKYVGDKDRFIWGVKPTGKNELEFRRDYNMNSPEGRAACTDPDGYMSQKCANFMKTICVDNPIAINPFQDPADLTNCLESNCAHIESDTCRIYYRTNKPDSKANALMSEYMTPFCMTKFNYLIDNLDYCRSNPNDDQCKYLNNLFNQNGNCSCFLQTDQVIQYMKEFGITTSNYVFPSATCYPDCAEHLDEADYPFGFFYPQFDPCANTVCIIDQNMDIGSIWASGSTINLVKASIECCGQTKGGDSSKCGQPGVIFSGLTQQKIASISLSISSLLLVIFIVISLMK